MNARTTGKGIQAVNAAVTMLGAVVAQTTAGCTVQTAGSVGGTIGNGNPPNKSSNTTERTSGNPPGIAAPAVGSQRADVPNERFLPQGQNGRKICSIEFILRFLKSRKITR